MKDEMTPTKAQLIETSLGSPLVIAAPKPAATPGPRNAAKVFLRSFALELFREISVTTKILVILFVASLFIGLFFLGALLHQKTNQSNLKQAEMLNRRIDEQEKLLEHLRQQTDKDQSRASVNKKTIESPLSSVTLATRVWKSYSGGTCLIAGFYRLLDRTTGLPLRFPDSEMTPEERLLTIGTEVPLTTSGKGEIFHLEFLGTGFHVGKGFVLTNRHVAGEPWEVDQRAQYLISRTGAIPRLERLLAYFPGRQQPVPLTLKRTSLVDDIAVCSLRSEFLGIPVLPLDQESNAIEVGEAVVTMGYPLGPDRLLAVLPEDEAHSLQSKYGDSLVTLLDQLAKRRLIKPLTTQGRITDLYTSRIVFDATTRAGSSGSPLLGESAQVIGISFAILVGDSASNFSIPIAAGIEELRKAGWTKE